MRVNMNHASTSGTKPREVIDALTAFLSGNSHQSAGRGGDEVAAARAALESRIALAKFFGAANPVQVIFTSGATESLNMAIYGLTGAGCHALATSLEHNAVARPLRLLERPGRIEVSWLPCGADGSFDPRSIHQAIRPNTRLLVMTHASNVLGNVLPVAAAFEIAKGYGLFTLLDAAQTAGHIEVKLDKNTDAIAFAGHKGLRGVAGVGGLILSAGVAEKMSLWKAGGTGSHSQSLDMPEFLPDRLEPGTPNLLGIISLGAAVEAIAAAGLETVRRHEKSLVTRFVTGLRQLPLILYGDYDEERWTPVVSLNIPGMDGGLLARRLSDEFGIETRSGLHCSPLAHKTIGTFPQGALRFSLGAETTAREVDYVLEALAKITAGR
ncbi:MAG: aminotransferase class V-fold PLP-dependent enzyme [Peptococcaceae bacterium]|jgi:cysteine desulfurase family protein|nr:aminotransferase class V-fold PLP-dependent enzyme [Peptococcaceae bacterium]